MSANTGEDDILDRWGKRIVNMAVAQGIPTPILSVMDLESIAPNRRGKAKDAITKCIQKSFPGEKVNNLDTETDALNLFRRIGGQKQKVLHNKDNRPHLFADHVEFVANESDSLVGTFKVTGFLRGAALDVNGLVHIPGLGDFQMNQIDATDDPFRFDRPS